MGSTPTSIIANNVLDIYTGQTTFLLGAVLNSKAGQLKLDTGDFVFDNFADKALQKQISVQAGTQSVGGSYYYSNKQGITYATVGAGQIVVRNKPGINLATLNRDPANVQRQTRDKTIDIKIPGIDIKVIVDAVKTAGDALAKLKDALAGQLQHDHADE